MTKKRKKIKKSVVKLKKAYIFAPSLEKSSIDQLAQLAEHLPFKERVLGSSPRLVTKRKLSFMLNFFLYLLHNYFAHVAELVDAPA